MSQPVIYIYWEKYLSVEKIPFTIKISNSPKGLIKLKFQKETTAFELIINEEEYWFSLTSSIDFPVNKLYFHPDKDKFVAQINSQVPMGLYCWSTKKNESDKYLLLFRTYQNLVCDIMSIGDMINSHFEHHDTYLRELAVRIAKSSELDLMSEFSKLKNPC